MSQKKEITYKIINSCLAGALVLFGAYVNQQDLSLRGFIAALAAAAVVAITQFKEYWDGEKTEYSNKLFTFIKL